MSLPQRVFFQLVEVAGRWGCSTTDIAGWAAIGRLEIVTGIPPTKVGDQIAAGLVVISAADILPMFRPSGTGPRTIEIRRMRELGKDGWLYIESSNPALEISRDDIVIMADEVARFEAECGFGVRAADDDNRERASTVSRLDWGGAPTRYDWDGFYMAMILRIHDHGVPAKQTDLIAEMQDWFIRNTKDGDPPEESTIRKRVNPIWRALRDRG